MASGTKNARTREQVAAALAAHPDIVRVFGRPGHVLLYPKHQPAGLYFVINGIVRRDDRLLDAARGPFLVPPYGEIDEPSPSTFVVARTTEMFFVPRSVALRDASFRHLLDKAGLAFKQPH